MSSVRGRLISAYYKADYQEFTLYFVLLTEDHKKITIPYEPSFKPYFYTTGEAVIFLKQCFEKIKASYTVTRDFNVKLLGKPIEEYAYKVEVDTPDKIGHIKRLDHWKKNIHFNDTCFFEGNIAYVLRYLIDMKLGIYLEFDLENSIISNWKNHPEIEPRILYFDIETDVDKLLSISYGKDFDTIRNHLAPEKDLFKALKLLMKTEYDFFISWTDYDEKFLKKRAKELKIDIDWHQICFIDQEFIMKETNRKCAGRSYLSLNTAAELLGLKIRKISMPKGLKWYYKNDQERFIRYNNRDVKIQLAIEEACGATAVWIDAIDNLGIPLSFATHVGIIADIDWLRKIKTRSKRILLPNGKKTKTGISFEGGGVTHDPPYGVFSDVFAVDLAGSYAGIIRTYNISPEVWSFVTNSFSLGKGIFPELIAERTAQRNEYKRLMKKCHKGSKEYKRYKAQQEGQKIIILQYWGQIGRETSSFFIPEVAAYITEMGRKHIDAAKETLKDEFDVNVHYFDTDSLYFQFLDSPRFNEQLVKGMFKSVLEAINSALEFLLDIKGIPMDRRFIKMEAQAFYDKVLWAGIAKNYMYLERYSADTDEWHNYPQLGIKGWVKLGSGRLALDVQHMIGRLIMDGVKLEGYGGLIGYLQCVRDDILKGNYDEGLVQDTGLSMLLKDYKSKTYVWYAAKRAKDKGLYKERTNLKWVITEAGTKPVAEGVFEGVIPKVKRSGYNYLWQKRVLSKAISVLKSIEKRESFIKNRINISSRTIDLMFGN